MFIYVCERVYVSVINLWNTHFFFTHKYKMYIHLISSVVDFYAHILHLIHVLLSSYSLHYSRLPCNFKM